MDRRGFKSSKRMGMVHEEIKHFLKDRPSFSLRGLEKEADLSTKTLSHYVNGRRKLSPEHIKKLIPVLSKYGFKQQ